LISKNLQDSGGKEYSRKVLFGDYDKYYLALVAQHYQLHITNQDLREVCEVTLR